MNITWLDKYRPDRLSELKTHDNIIKSLTNMKDKGIIPNLLCYGPSGSGKTTTMNAFGNSIYGKYSKLNIMTINASDERGIYTIREKIIKFAETQSFFALKKRNIRKIIILDECDSMNYDSQYSIMNLMDKFDDILFIFICNYIYKIHDVIKSRCLTLYFKPIHINNIQQIIKTIVDKENIDISNEGIKILCSLSNNDMRTALYTLQTMHYSGTRITPNNIYKYNQYPTNNNINKIIELTKKSNVLDVYKYIYSIVKKNGILLKYIINKVYEYVLSINDIPEEKQRIFIENMANIEYTLTYEHTLDIIIGTFVSELYMIKEYLS